MTLRFPYYYFGRFYEEDSSDEEEILTQVDDLYSVISLDLSRVYATPAFHRNTSDADIVARFQRLGHHSQVLDGPISHLRRRWIAVSRAIIISRRVQRFLNRQRALLDVLAREFYDRINRDSPLLCSPASTGRNEECVGGVGGIQTSSPAGGSQLSGEEGAEDRTAPDSTRGSYP